MEASQPTSLPDEGSPECGATAPPGETGIAAKGAAERGALRLTRRSPRWLRRFIVASRRANIFLWLELLSVAGLIMAVIATWFAFSRDPESGDLLPTFQVSLLLMATLVPAMAILVLAGRRLALRRAAGSTARLHVRLVFFFSMVSAVPTLLVAGFAAFLFQTGVDFWFSDDSRGLMENANELAQNYYDANQRDVRDETLAMAGDMRFYFSRGGTLANEEFPDFYALQAQGRKINESAIIQRLDDGSLRTAAIMDLVEDNRPLDFSTGALPRLASGELVVVEGSPERIAAIAPIDRESGIYLYNARNTE